MLTYLLLTDLLREGIEACVDFYTGSGAPDSLVTRVTTVSEWKQALDDAGDRPVCTHACA